MSKRVLDEYQKFPEVNLFLRGTVKMLGFQSCILKYERKKRLAGTSKYNLKKMIALALDGITSTSIKPVRLITAFGFFISLISFLTFFAYPFLLKKIHVGEYVAKTYLETKKRPKFIIEDFLQ